MPGESRLNTYRPIVDARLESLLPLADAVPVELHQAMRYSALAPGKRLRPALCMAAAEATSGDPSAGLDAGCAVEFVHAFSLIHDDLPAIDDDDLRRGRPTCHKVYGEAIALLAGDALFSLAFQVLASVPGDPARVATSLRVLAESTGTQGLVGGEVMDVLGEGMAPELGLVKTIHERKTGALIAAACQIGGLLGGGSEEEVRAILCYGKLVGLAFQIADDVLDETSTPEELGKPVGSDRDAQKITYPAAIGIDASTHEARALVENACLAVGPLGERAGALRELAQFAALRKN